MKKIKENLGAMITDNNAISIMLAPLLNRVYKPVLVR